MTVRDPFPECLRSHQNSGWRFRDSQAFESALAIDGFVDADFGSLRLQCVPITRGSDVEQRVVALGDNEPTMLMLDHNVCLQLRTTCSSSWHSCR